MRHERPEPVVGDAVDGDRLAVVHRPQQPAQVASDVRELGEDLSRALRGGSAAFELLALRDASAAATSAAVLRGGIEVGIARRRAAGAAAAGRRLPLLPTLLILLVLLVFPALLVLLALLVLALLVLALLVLLGLFGGSGCSPRVVLRSLERLALVSEIHRVEVRDVLERGAHLRVVGRHRP